MSETKFTPTPWKAIDERILTDRGYLIAVTDCSNLTWQEDEANAAHIVKCVNMHDELVDQMIILRDSISGSCYLGKEAEISIIEDILKKAGAL